MDSSAGASGSSSSAGASASVQKRSRADSRASSSKRARTDDSDSSPKPDPYTTLPPPTTQYITLYFQLARFKRVFRVVEVPLNYTFAHLHTLIQFLFGWSGEHLHEMEVLDRVVLYKTRKGEIKEAGRIPEHQRELMEAWDPNRRMPHFKGEGSIWNVVPRMRGARRKNEWSRAVDDKWDPDATLGEVWNVDEEQNLSHVTDGDSSNEEIAIKYHYDLGSPWDVHISCNEENLFITKNPASNLPFVRKANGAPPLEDVPIPEPVEADPHKKHLPGLLWARDVFAKYCLGEIHSVTLENKLDIYTEAEAEGRRKEQRRKEKQRRRDWLVEHGMSDDEEGDSEVEPTAVAPQETATPVVVTGGGPEAAIVLEEYEEHEMEGVQEAGEDVQLDAEESGGAIGEDQDENDGAEDDEDEDVRRAFLMLYVAILPLVAAEQYTAAFTMVAEFVQRLSDEIKEDITDDDGDEDFEDHPRFVLLMACVTICAVLASRNRNAIMTFMSSTLLRLI